MTVVTQYNSGTFTGVYFFVLGNINSDDQRFVAVGSVGVGGPKDYSMFTCSHSNIGHTTHYISCCSIHPKI
jgi:hypothetical protein